MRTLSHHLFHHVDPPYFIFVIHEQINVHTGSEFRDLLSLPSFWGSCNCFRPACPSITKFCTHNSSYIFKGKSLKMCMLDYYYCENRISIQHIDWIMFDGIIALFDLEYFIKKYVLIGNSSKH